MERDLTPLFSPASVAVVGASSRPDSLAGAVLNNLTRGGFSGALYAVHPREAEVGGIPTASSVAGLPEAPDLAVVGVAAPLVSETVSELLGRGTKAFVILSAGFGEADAEGAVREQQLIELCHERGALLLGPNCLGLHVATPDHRLHASFSRELPEPGSVAVISHSGSIAEWLGLRLRKRGVGISLLTGVGNGMNLGVAHLLNAIPRHVPEVRNVFLYLERAPSPELWNVAGALPPETRIVVLLGGTATKSSLPSGIHEAAGLNAAADLLEAWDRLPRMTGRRVAVITNAGGPGALAADGLRRAGAEVRAPRPPLADTWRETLPGIAIVANPLDLTASAGPGDYDRALEALLAQPDGVDAVLVVFMPSLVTDASAVAQVLAARLGGSRLPAVVSWLGGPDTESGVGRLRKAGLAVIRDPGRAGMVLGSAV